MNFVVKILKSFEVKHLLFYPSEDGEVNITSYFVLVCFSTKGKLQSSLLAEVSHGEAKMRGGRDQGLSLLSFLPRRERPLLAGKLQST